jgi:alanyl-tRNA synthetase
MRGEGSATISGDAAFKLYDTYGFPIDLTEVICQEKGVKVDLEGYQRALEETRARSEFVGDTAVALEVYRQALDKAPGKQVRFVGYEREAGDGRVVAIIQKGALVERASAQGGGDSGGTEIEIVLDSTPFYGEAGGQIGDRGKMTAPGVKLEITDTQKPIQGIVVHRARLQEGELAVGATLHAEVDHTRRDATRRAHSATHLLHFALRRVLGEQAQQKGSLVEPDRFRFDFTSGRALTPDERAEVEDLVNQKVLVNAPVETEVLPIDQAKKRGAVAIFEEKYGDIVRVLTMTADSVELCGGTHARATGDIGLFKIVSEGGIAAGVRRIEARTGLEALKYVRTIESTLKQAEGAVKASGGDLVDKVGKLVAENRRLDKKVIELSTENQMLKATGGSKGDGEGALLDRAREVGGIKVLSVAVEVSDAGALRELAEKLRDKLGDSVVLVGSKSGPKVQLVLTVARALVPRLKAPDLIRPLAQIVGGSGGGRPDMAQAGGSDVSKLEEALEGLPRVVGAAIGAGEQAQA